MKRPNLASRNHDRRSSWALSGAGAAAISCADTDAVEANSAADTKSERVFMGRESSTPTSSSACIYLDATSASGGRWCGGRGAPRVRSPKALRGLLKFQGKARWEGNLMTFGSAHWNRTVAGTDEPARCARFARDPLEYRGPVDSA